MSWVPRASVDLIEFDDSFVDDVPSHILFLDFDGVLHDDADLQAGRAFSRLELLSRAVNEADGNDIIKLVICSDWRLDTRLDDLRALLGSELGKRVIGVTPDLLHRGCNRGDEVTQWIESNAPDALWLALDDRPNWYPNSRSQVIEVVRTDEGGPGALNEPIAMELCARLRTILKGKEPKP